MNGLPTPTPEGCISDLQLDKWHAAELSTEKIQSLRAHLATCERCARREQALSTDASEFLRRFPEPPRAPARSVRLAPRRATWLALASAGLAVAAALLIWLRLPTTELGTRSKGSASLSFFVKHGQVVTPGVDGQQVQAGDRLRFVVSTTRAQHVAILGRDGVGAAFVYYPAEGRSAALGVVHELALDSSVELDQTPGTEQIWGVFCDESFDAAQLKNTLAATGKVSQRAGCSLVALHVVKGPEP